jgi:hypothetical protein
MPIDKPDAEDRLEQRYRKLGTRTPSCVCCGYDDPLALELHHIAGQKHHDDLSIVCRNCHRRLSDQQLDHPEDVAGQDTTLAAISHYLMGLADLFRMLADRLVEFGRHLIELANGSDDQKKEESQ